MPIVAFITAAGFVSVIAILRANRWAQHREEDKSITSYTLGSIWTISSAVMGLTAILSAVLEAYSKDILTASGIASSLLIVAIFMVVGEIIVPATAFVMKVYLRKPPETSFMKGFDVARKDEFGDLYKTLGKNGVLFITLELLLIFWLFIGAIIIGSGI